MEHRNGFIRGDSSSMVDGTLKAYRHYREYTEGEIRSEQDEYFDNEVTKKALPNMFRDRDDVTFHVKDAPLELLDRHELNSLRNSDVKEILSEPTQKARMLATLRLMKKYDKNYKSLYRAFARNEKLPPPLVVRDKNNDLYLLAGNSRMMMAIAFGYNMPVKTLKFSKEIVGEQKIKQNDLLDVAKKLTKKYGVRSKLTFKSGTGNKADYDWAKDIIYIRPSYSTVKDFLTTIYHEIDHARDRKKYGAKTYEKKYQRAGDLAVNRGRDFHDDNAFEEKAEKYGRKMAAIHMKKK